MVESWNRRAWHGLTYFGVGEMYSNKLLLNSAHANHVLASCGASVVPLHMPPYIHIYIIVFPVETILELHLRTERQIDNGAIKSSDLNGD